MNVNKLELNFISFSFANIGPRNLNAKTNKKGKSIVGDEEEFEDINEGEELSLEDEDGLSDVDLGDDDEIWMI